MTLNKQLLCVSLLLLSLPWAGAKFLQEMDALLKQGQIDTLQATSRVIAQALSKKPERLSPHPLSASQPEGNASSLYCHPMPTQVWMDGYDDEWSQVPEQHYQSANNQPPLKYRCGVRNDEVSLFLKIHDEEIIYNNPSKSLVSNGDRVILSTGSGRDYIFTTAGQGKITPRYYQRPGVTYRESRIDAAWADKLNGFQLEIKLPLALLEGKLSFTVINESHRGVSKYGPGTEQDKPPWLTYQAPAITEYLEDFEQENLRLRLLDPQGYLIASVGQYSPQQPPSGHWLMRKLYRALLSEANSNLPLYHNGVDYSLHREVARAKSGDKSSQWYRLPEQSNQYLLTTALAIKNGDNVQAILITEQSSEQTAALTDQAFSRLLKLSAGVLLSAIIGLLIYASWLSWRIRQLSRAAQWALENPASLASDFPNSRAQDEIGSLTRNYFELMTRINEYTEYLQNLSRKLSHELRTPLAIIHSSLDNLASQNLDEASHVYQQRGKDGALRLGKILTAMSEARRVEESLEHAEVEEVDLAQLLLDLGKAYQDIYREHRIVVSGISNNQSVTSGQTIEVMPDLLVQMLDKLVDNASDFCPKGKLIDIHYKTTPQNIEICVSNDGPLLPQAMQSQLFDNMVSLREEDAGETHLGLGLHIVQLIVKAHSGKISARNRNDSSGVAFSIVIPRN